MIFMKYFVTSLVVGTTAVLLGWIISPETAAIVWHSLPGLCCLRGMLFGVFDRYIPLPIAEVPISNIPEGVSVQSTPSRIFSLEELKQYDGSEESKGLYLAFLGKVYDVSKGKQHYGPGGGYSFFAARDATRAFVTGDFTDEGLVEDIDGLSPREMLEVKHWVEFYEKDYTPVGILEGHFYDANGKPKEALHKAEAQIKEGLKEQAAAEEDKKRFPPCNSEWKQGSGRVWCSNLSGGVSRNWEGFPRKYYTQGAANWRCACVREEHLNKAMFREFEDCPPTSVSCKLIK
ncbi:neuferricin-like [Amphiura filiformis]|uniref:neuferricin-like n=1 Tax=Amphiura filiformis TaxID=82378 RepID=UPI003B21C717